MLLFDDQECDYGRLLVQHSVSTASERHQACVEYQIAKELTKVGQDPSIP